MSWRPTDMALPFRCCGMEASPGRTLTGSSPRHRVPHRVDSSRFLGSGGSRLTLRWTTAAGTAGGGALGGARRGARPPSGGGRAYGWQEAGEQFPNSEHGDEPMRAGSPAVSIPAPPSPAPRAGEIPVYEVPIDHRGFTR